jgi:hypothetical protein
MPNKRHPARKFIGFWATAFVKDSLQKHALKQQITLSVLMADILHEYLLKKRNAKGRYNRERNFEYHESNFNRPEGNPSN